MNIPVSDKLLDSSSTDTVSVPLTSDEVEWLRQQAEERDLSKRQFVRYLINRIMDAEAQLKDDASSDSASEEEVSHSD
jgi:hypothetical protein